MYRKMKSTIAWYPPMGGNCHSKTKHWGFKKSTKIKLQLSTRVVIATCALGMDINFPRMHYVFQYGPPKSIVDLMQQAGHGGQDGSQTVWHLKKWHLPHVERRSSLWWNQMNANNQTVQLLQWLSSITLSSSFTLFKLEETVYMWYWC